MSFRDYLPSAQFSLTVGSLLLAGGLVYGAQAVVSSQNRPAEVVVAQNSQENMDWQAQLEAIQANTPQAPAAPDQTVVAQIKDSVKSSNLTQTIGKTLFVNLAEANAQGLGSDAPTQDRLVTEAAAQLQAEKTPASYSAADLVLVAQTKDSLHTYGNRVMQVFNQHPTASAAQTLYNVGYATDYQDQKTADALGPIGEDYLALADELATVPVPQGLAPLHLQLLSDLSAMAAVFPDMQLVLKDPLRGLAGLQVFQSKGGEAARVLTSIAQSLSKNAILFNKDEAGSAWSVFLSS